MRHCLLTLLMVLRFCTSNPQTFSNRQTSCLDVAQFPDDSICRSMRNILSNPHEPIEAYWTTEHEVWTMRCVKPDWAL